MTFLLRHPNIFLATCEVSLYFNCTSNIQQSFQISFKAKNTKVNVTLQSKLSINLCMFCLDFEPILPNEIVCVRNLILLIHGYSYVCFSHATYFVCIASYQLWLLLILFRLWPVDPWYPSIFCSGYGKLRQVRFEDRQRQPLRWRGVRVSGGTRFVQQTNQGKGSATRTT